MADFTLWHWVVLLVVFSVVFLPAILGIFVFRQKKVLVIHPSSGMRKTARLGWSWTYWYFGFLVPVFRGEIGIGILHAIISVITFGLFQLIMSFLYNKHHITRLLERGWLLAPEELAARRTLGMET